MKYHKKIFITLFYNSVIFGIFSCTPYKQVPYFQDLTRNRTSNEKINNYSPLTMQPGDLLGINVTSLNHEADLIFNYKLAEQPGTEITPIAGYLIDRNGNIDLPLVGLIKVLDYTTMDISSLLESKLQTYLSKPVVTVRILNFKISVLGDVKSPGTFNIQDEKITLPQGLSLAGDLNTTALRKNVLLIREQDSTRKYINVDLTSKNIFNSPYYYLKNNDVIYAQPSRAKVANESGLSQKIGATLSVLSIIVYYLTRR